MSTMFNVLMEVLGIAMLSIPLIWELWNDKNGDAHISRAGWNTNTQMLSKQVDIVARCAMAATVAMGNTFLGGHSLLASIVMSGAIHFLLFDYIIVVILVKNGVIAPSAKWWEYLGSKGMDNIEWWRGRTWGARMAFRIAVFIIACVMYF